MHGVCRKIHIETGVAVVAKQFDELAREARATWSTEAEREYREQSTALATEFDRREALGVSIAAARLALGVTQSELAATAGIQQADVSRIERGVSNPTASTLNRIAAALGRTLTLA